MHMTKQSLILILFLSIASYFNCGFGVKTPLTNVNPINIVKYAYHKSLLAQNIKPSDVQDLPLNVIKSQLEVSFDLNSSCIVSLKGFAEDVIEVKPNALEILDAWGKPESGILDGNINFEGRYFECLSAKFDNNVASQYCAFHLAIPVSLNPFGAVAPVSGASVGLCLPQTCTNAELNKVLVNPNHTGGVIQNVECISSDQTWKAKDILAMVILCMLALLVCLSTVYDYISSQKSIMNEMLHDKMNWNEQLAQSSVNDNPTIPQLNTRRRLLLSFSVIQNTKRLLDTTQRPTDITCLHGMRFLSMSWVILGHSFLFLVNYVDNVRYIARYTIKHYEFQAITNAFFSVDTFFFLSGLLVVYLGMRQLNRRAGKMNVPFMYLYRYLRLTPPYAFLIFISITLLPKWGDGPFWPLGIQSLVNTCSKYWYTNLLYFNNLYPANIADECWGWGWYLANDTQFYLLTPLFLWLLYKSRVIGLSVISFFLLASITITGAFSSHTKQQITPMLYGLIAKLVAEPKLPTSNSTLPFGLRDSATNPTYSPYMVDLYGKPWCRIGAYLVGMIAGYILHSTNNKLKMNKIVVCLGWLVAAGVNFQLVYCSFSSYSQGTPWSVNLAAFYNAVSRPVWCVGLAWVTIACVNGYGGPVNTLLSWKAFIPLSRLTYCSYLIHPLVIDWFIGSSEVQAHFSIYFVVTVFLFTLMFTTMLAYVVAMLVEFPVVELLKIMQESMLRARPSPSLYQQCTDENSLLPNGESSNPSS